MGRSGFSGDHEDELETLSRMTNTPTVHEDFASSLTSFFLSFKIDWRRIFGKSDPRPNYYENAVGLSCRHIAWSRLRDSRARGIEEARTQKREETVERRGGSRLSLSRLQFPTLLRLPHYLRAWNRRVDRRHINLLFHSTNCVSYIGTFSQQNRKSRVGTLD